MLSQYAFNVGPACHSSGPMIAHTSLEILLVTDSRHMVNAKKYQVAYPPLLMLVNIGFWDIESPTNTSV